MLNSLNHVAIIMDGNRRWAKKRFLMPWQGHQNGALKLKEIINVVLKENIKILTLYTFSLENFKRSKEEIQHIFQIIIEESIKNLDYLLENGIKVNFIGDKNYFPDHLKFYIENIENKTMQLDKLILNILFCYGGQQEIFNAVKLIAHDISNNILSLNDLNKEKFESYIWTGKIGSPDLIIRTGGFKRLSNFMLYNSAYSEIYFTDTLWPDLTNKEFQEAINDFYKRERKFGN